MRSTFFIILSCSSAETMGIGTCSMCERSNLTELNFFEIKKATTLELSIARTYFIASPSISGITILQLFKESVCLLDIKKGRLYNMVGRTYALFGIMMEQKR